jgi:hypothetical protein
MRFNTNIDAEKTPKELLDKFYKDYGLPPDGGQSDSRVKIEAFKGFHFFIPNFKARKKAVLKHDTHHLLTEYSSHFIGESEISAWEIASGCKKYWPAFFIDLSGMMIGLLFDFRGVYRAFVRGRRSANLYHDILNAELVNRTPLKELRNKLHIPPPDSMPKAGFSDFALFMFTLFIGGIYSITSFVLLPPLVIYNLVLLVTGKWQ